MPAPILYLVGVLVVGGIAAAVAGGGKTGGVIELGPKQGTLQLKPPIAMLVYRTSETGKAIRKVFGDVAAEYRGDKLHVGVQAIACTLDAMLAMDAEQGGLMGANIEAAFGEDMAAMVVLLPAPGAQSAVEDFMENYDTANAPALLHDLFEWLTGDHTVAAFDGPSTVTPLDVGTVPWR